MKYYLPDDDCVNVIDAQDFVNYNMVEGLDEYPTRESVYDNFVHETHVLFCDEQDVNEFVAAVVRACDALDVYFDKHDQSMLWAFMVARVVPTDKPMQDETEYTHVDTQEIKGWWPEQHE
jgi:hypothetical protein